MSTEHIDFRGNRRVVRYIAAELAAELAARPADAPCVWCEGSGEVWISGYWIPCYCDCVRAVNLRLRERVAELEAEIAALHAPPPAHRPAPVGMVPG